MYKFNDERIFIGYLKQLLKDFNLPKYKVYTKEFQQYKDWWDGLNDQEKKLYPPEDPRIIESVPATAKREDYAHTVEYIRGSSLQKYINKAWQTDTSRHYHYNKKELNHTKNLVIKNNYYDTYTHEYLGDYLRFQRDYNGINLMSMYNCFSNNVCKNVKLKGKIFNANTQKNYEFNFDTTDSNYKIYIVPVKLFEKYTIAMDSSRGAELCCVFYDKYLNTLTSIKDMPNSTYVKYSSLTFNSPVIYDALDVKYWRGENTKPSRAEIVQRENSLHLLIKVPREMVSSITILEGDFLNYNDAIYKRFNTPLEIGAKKIDQADKSPWELKANRWVINHRSGVIQSEEIDENGDKQVYESILPDLNDRGFKPISKLQLLAMNTGESYPFADRLVEYLLGNTVDNTDDNVDNVIRVQKVMENNGHKFKYPGLWENKMQMIIYDFLNESHPNIGRLDENKKYDLLGYVDKDAEQFYTSWERIKEKDGEKTILGDSIASVDIYEGIFKDKEE